MKERRTESAFSEHLFEYRTVAARRLALSLTITAGMIVYSAHVELEDVPNPAAAESLVARMNSHLSEWYGIIESAIQVGSSDEAGVCEIS